MKEKLINYIISWTPDQLSRFLDNEITQEILQPEAKAEFSPQKDDPAA